MRWSEQQSPTTKEAGRLEASWRQIQEAYRKNLISAAMVVVFFFSFFGLAGCGGIINPDGYQIVMNENREIPDPLPNDYVIPGIKVIVKPGVTIRDAPKIPPDNSTAVGVIGNLYPARRGDQPPQAVEISNPWIIKGGPTTRQPGIKSDFWLILPLQHEDKVRLVYVAITPQTQHLIEITGTNAPAENEDLRDWLARLQQQGVLLPAKDVIVDDSSAMVETLDNNQPQPVAVEITPRSAAKNR
ncbi:MAG: hypothetical protein GXP43_02735 [bacterium]|nr:hypothetical protein [bacterium]